MDHNSPIYREKYLKYKKKYMELKALEQDAGFLKGLKEKASKAMADAKKAASKAAGTDPQSMYNKEIMALYQKQVNAYKKFRDKLVSGITKVQQTEITKELDNKLSTGTAGFGRGPVAKAIRSNKDMPENKEQKLKDILKENLENNKKTYDNVKDYAKPILQEKLETVYKNVLDKVNTQSVKDANKEVNAQSIANLNKQVLVEELCKKMELSVNACDKERVDAATIAFEKLEFIIKTKAANTKTANTYEITRKNAQNKMNDYANELAKEAGVDQSGNATIEDLSGLVEKVNLKMEKELLSNLNMTDITGELTKEKLISGFANKDYKVPEGAFSKKTEEKAPESPKGADTVPDVDSEEE